MRKQEAVSGTRRLRGRHRPRHVGPHRPGLKAQVYSKCQALKDFKQDGDGIIFSYKHFLTLLGPSEEGVFINESPMR